jgi:hypothetical protein
MSPVTEQQEELVVERLEFAERRLRELLALNDGDLSRADVKGRQQLPQEFFFHLVGGINMLAQVVNQVRGLGINTEDVSPHKVATALKPHPLGAQLGRLYERTKGEHLPTDPYTDQAYIFRIYNYRNQVAHVRRNPFLFRVGALPPASLWLDPREPDGAASTRSVQEELEYMMNLVRNRCLVVLSGA